MCLRCCIFRTPALLLLLHISTLAPPAETAALCLKVPSARFCVLHTFFPLRTCPRPHRFPNADTPVLGHALYHLRSTQPPATAAWIIDNGM